MAVDRERRIGFVRFQHHFDRRSRALESGVGYRAIAEDWRVSGRQKQGVAIAQRAVEMFGQMQNPVARRRGAPAFDETQVLLRDVGLGSEGELAEAALLPPRPHEGACRCRYLVHRGSVGAGRPLDQ
jgi:hypothetical protein